MRLTLKQHLLSLHSRFLNQYITEGMELTEQVFQAGLQN